MLDKGLPKSYNSLMEIKDLQSTLALHEREFDSYFNELIEGNKVANLTAITEKLDVEVKHFLDSVLPIEEIKKGASVVDVGTGAGFPGLPIKIVRPDIKLSLVDSLNKRVAFLNNLVKNLGLKDVEIFHLRAEEFCAQFRETFDVAVARAVAKTNTLLEYLLPLVKVGGIVLAYKGSGYSEELIEAQNALAVLGGKIEKVLTFALPHDFGERNIIVIKKVKPTPAKYPRPQNKPKLDPIS